MALPSDWTSADLWVLLRAPSTCFEALTLAGGLCRCTCPRQCKHSPRVHAHRPGTTTSLKDSKAPRILLPLETFSIMITSPLFLGPPLTRPQLQTLDTLHGTSDTRSCGGRFLWAPELTLRAVEEGPEGQVSSLAAGTRVSSCPCPLPLALETHLLVPTPRSPFCLAPCSSVLPDPATYLLSTWSKVTQAPATSRLPTATVREEKGEQTETQPRRDAAEQAVWTNTRAQKDTQRPDRSPGPPRRAHMLG